MSEEAKTVLRELVPQPLEIKRHLSTNYQQATALRRLLKIAEQAWEDDQEGSDSE